MKNKNANLQNKLIDISKIKIQKNAKIKKNIIADSSEEAAEANIIENRDDKVMINETNLKNKEKRNIRQKAKTFSAKHEEDMEDQEKLKHNEYEAYLRSIKEICNLALKNGDLRSALSAKKLEADWIKQNKCAKEKFGINSMSDEELENLIKELENGFHKLG